MNMQLRILFSALALTFAAAGYHAAHAQGSVAGGTAAQSQSSRSPTENTAKGGAAQSAPSTSSQSAQAAGGGSAGGAQAGASLLNMKAGEISGREVYNTEGKELGKVDMIGRDRTSGNLSAIIAVGGFLGFGGSKVAVPLDQLALQDDKLTLSTVMSKKDLREQAAGYQSKRYEAVAEDTTLSQVAPAATAGAQAGQGGAAAGGAAASTAFQTFDKNRDGFITPDEATRDKTLVTNWRELDRNNDGRLDSAEFSAFEQSGTMEPSDMLNQQQQAQPMPPTEETPMQPPRGAAPTPGQ